MMHALKAFKERCFALNLGQTIQDEKSSTNVLQVHIIKAQGIQLAKQSIPSIYAYFNFYDSFNVITETVQNSTDPIFDHKSILPVFSGSDLDRYLRTEKVFRLFIV